MFGGGTTTFGSSQPFGSTQTSSLGLLGSTTTSTTPKDIEVESPPDDSISCLEFSPATMQQVFLIAGSWDNNVSSWK